MIAWLVSAAWAADLAVEGTCPGLAALVATATPNGRVAWLTGPGPGDAVIPSGRCVGVASGLSEVRFKGVTRADAAGEARWPLSLPGAACGGVAQALDLVTCALSPPAVFVDGRVDGDGDGVPLADDCDDADPTVSPLAREVCGGGDEDCDGAVDAGCAWTGAWLAADASVAGLTGANRDEAVGFAVHLADLDGDGAVDLVAGAPEGTRGAGWVGDGGAYVLWGPLAGAATLADADRVTGVDANDVAGWQVASWDADRDGQRDLVLGAPGFDALLDPGAEDQTGAALVYLAAGRAFDAPFALRGTYAVLDTGLSLSVGDVDDDGWGDLVLAVPDDADHTGAVYLFDAPHVAAGTTDDAGAFVTGEDAWSFAGYSVAVLGDTDGDGRAEVAVGAPYSDRAGRDSGRAWVVPGDAFSGSLADALIIDGASPGAYAGYTVAAAGDVDGDGLADALIGAPQTAVGTGGTAAWVSGAALGVGSLALAPGFVFGSLAGERVGSGVCGLGDLDGDGQGEVAVAASGTDTVALFSGADLAGAVAFSAARASFTADGAGESLACGADATGDGVPDLVIGAEATPSGGAVDAGAAWLIGLGPLL